MSKPVRLDDLRDLCRLYADQRQSTFITDTELDSLINLKLGELYDMLVAARGHEHYQTDDTVSIVSGTAAYALPEDFYQLLAVTLEWDSTDVEPVDALNSYQDIWAHSSYQYGWNRWTCKSYRIQGANIVFYPTPQAAVTARLYYVPVFEDLVADSDTFDSVNGWHKMVALGVASEMREIEEESTGAALLQQHERERERIEQLAADRDASIEIQVRNVRGRRLRYPTATGLT